ncbi:hypothetical protein AAFF_G00159020 [Aldrovandia affinis]|uniref:Uncharacterized protein n=1 Tax=Aldrovandia affinis TaxID=143900 RepID=A0AAD7RN64_9TELE|nr:hypothetical protein AAFF_G00159020 [Aldrovandia affinis]
MLTFTAPWFRRGSSRRVKSAAVSRTLGLTARQTALKYGRARQDTLPRRERSTPRKREGRGGVGEFSPGNRGGGRSGFCVTRNPPVEPHHDTACGKQEVPLTQDGADKHSLNQHAVSGGDETHSTSRWPGEPYKHSIT